MRGQPWLRLLFVIVVFVAMSVPVWRLTHPVLPAAVAAQPSRADDSPAPLVTLAIEIAFAGQPPSDFQLKHLGKILLQNSGNSVESTYHSEWSARLSNDGEDLTFEAHWPTDSPPAAARVSVSFPDGHKVEKTFWNRGTLVEIITVLPASPDA